MPIRIKCRCGQEHVLRVGEWLYFLAGLLIVSVFLNVCVLIVLFVYPGSESRPGESVQGLEDAASLAESVERLAVKQAVPASPAAQPSEKAVEAAETSVVDAPVETLAPPAESHEQAVVEGVSPHELPGPSSVEIGERSIADIVASRESAILDRSSEFREDPQAEDVTSGQVPSSASGREPAQRRSLLPERTALERLVLVEALTADNDGVEYPEVLAALIHDPDERVRALAISRLAKELDHGSVVDSVQPWLSAAAGWIAHEESGVPLRRWVSGQALEVHQATFTLSWDRVSRTGKAVLDQLEGYGALRTQALAPAKVDVLIAIDVSESMEQPFAVLRSSSEWLLPTVLWSLPGSRVGLLFYRDEVESTADFDLPVADKVALLRRESARGGGDVPEGVATAIRAALQLGRFAWREDARKELIVVGDAPPPFDQVRGMLSLVRLARLEVGLRVHAVSLQPEKERTSVPFFLDLARAGKGRALTVNSEDLPGALLKLLFPRECSPLLDLACAVLER